ncbi:MAG TPA: DUF29 domain-containing protein [Caulobacteraceae bacterium]|nr:DUF29 domain-containing protein [Caulobacteraceae bacterium]
MGKISYDADVVLWSREQAEALRAGRFEDLDIEHLADEIEDVGKSEKRELASRMATILAHLLKWRFQPDRRGNSWLGTIKEQRAGIDIALEETPSLRGDLNSDKWLTRVWSIAVARAVAETGFPETAFPTACPWTTDQILSPDWAPEA